MMSYFTTYLSLNLLVKEFLKLVNIWHSYRPDALPVAQPTASKHWRQIIALDADNSEELTSSERDVPLRRGAWERPSRPPSSSSVCVLSSCRCHCRTVEILRTPIALSARHTTDDSQLYGLNIHTIWACIFALYFMWFYEFLNFKFVNCLLLSTWLCYCGCMHIVVAHVALCC